MIFRQHNIRQKLRIFNSHAYFIRLIIRLAIYPFSLTRFDVVAMIKSMKKIVAHLITHVTFNHNYPFSQRIRSHILETLCADKFLFHFLRNFLFWCSKLLFPCIPCLNKAIQCRSHCCVRKSHPFGNFSNITLNAIKTVQASKSHINNNVFVLLS